MKLTINERVIQLMLSSGKGQGLTNCQRLSPSPDETSLQVKERRHLLKDVQAGQLLSVSALVTNLSAITVVKKRNTGENLTVRECQLTDPTGSIKLVLWQSFVEKVEEG